jgi:hypothetical protein
MNSLMFFLQFPDIYHSRIRKNCSVVGLALASLVATFEAFLGLLTFAIATDFFTEDFQDRELYLKVF